MRDKFRGASLQRGNTASGLLIGLLIGVLIAAAIAAYINFGPKPFTTPAGKNDTAAKTAQSGPAAVPQGVIALPGKPGDQPVIKPTTPVPAADTPSTTPHQEAGQSVPAAPAQNKFDFYKILPGGDAASAPAPAKPEPAAADNKVFVQVASLQNPSDADNLKARLALMGVEAKVQRVDLQDKGVFYRVRLGPYASASDADSVRGKLATEGIESSIVRSNTAQTAAKKP